MGKRQFIVALLFLFFLITDSCVQNANKNYRNDLITINIDTVISDAPIHFSTLFSDFQIIPLELNEESVIDNIQKLKFVNDTFYIFNGGRIKTVFLFSKHGKYLNKICRIGKGPGEYLEPINFDIDEKDKKIFVYDWAGKKLNIYGTDGNYLHNINFINRFSSFINSDYGFYFFIPSPENPKNQDACLLYQFNKKGKIISKGFKFKDYGYGLEYKILPRMGNFFKAKNNIKLYMPLCDTIFSIENKQVKPFILLNTVKYKLTKADIFKLKSKNLFSLQSDLKGLNKLNNIRDYGEFNNFAFFKFDIGFKRFWTFYNFETHICLSSSNRVDDLTFLGLDLFTINDHQFAGIVSQLLFPKLREVVTSGLLKLSNDDKQKILKISEDDNPLIIIYHAKEN